ncbi:MAG: OsmC family protein [bacterium]
MAIRPKMVVTQKLEGIAVTHARTDVTVGDHTVTIDEPEARGGTNLGPSPTETMMTALVACSNVISHKLAEREGVEIKDMKIRAEAQFDRRGVALQEDIAVPYPEIKLFIDLSTDGDPAKIARVREDLNKYCAVSKVLRQSGSEITEYWTVNGE